MRDGQSRVKSVKAIKYSITPESVVINDLGEAIEPPLHLEEFSDELQLLRSRPEDLSEQRLREMGQRLFQRVFTGSVLERYHSTGTAALALEVENELASLPWELLHDGADWIARTRGIVRIAATEQRAPGILPKPGALRVLAAIAGPLLHDDDSPQPHLIDVNAHAEIFRKLEGARFPAEIKLRKHVTRETLSWEVSENYHVIHFVGHGSAGSLIFETRHGLVDVADEDWLREQITVALRGNLRLVVLNSCFSADAGDNVSGVAETILETGVPALIGMQGSISELADIALMRDVYGGLGRGRAIDEAVMDARRAMAADWQIKPWEWATPVLFINGSLLEEGASLSLMDADMAKMIIEPKVKIIEPPGASPDPMMSRDEKFAGRRKELVDVLRSLDPENRNGVQVVCLHGDAGMGKTAIAIEAANRMLEWFDDVIWLSERSAPLDELREHVTGDGLTAALARKCGAEINGDEGEMQLRDSILEALSDGRRRLLVLDGMERFAESDLSLITKANCKVLITSQESLEMDERQVHVSPMNSRDSEQLLSAYCLLKGLRIASEEAGRIIHFAGGNPMVMRLVVSQALSGERTLDDALADLEKARGIVFDYVFTRSMTLAGTDGRKVFAAMAVFSPTASRKALQSACGLGDLDFEKAIRRVAGLSLVESYGQGKRFGLHQLARARAYRQLESDSGRENYRERAARFFVELVNATAPMTRPEVAARALGASTLEGKGFQRIQDAAVEIFVKPAIEVLETELINCFFTLEFLLARDDVDTANVLFSDLSGFLTARGYWDEAVYYLTRISLKDQGKSYDEVAVRLGALYQIRGDPERAIQLYDRALGMKHEMGARADQRIILDNIALLHSGRREWMQAASACLESFQIAVEIHPSAVINSLWNVLQVSRDMFRGGEFALPAQLAQQLTQLIQNIDPADNEMRTALAICHGVFATIGFTAAGECSKESQEYREALELARSLDERTGAALKLVEWLEGSEENRTR